MMSQSVPAEKLLGVDTKAVLFRHSLGFVMRLSAALLSARLDRLVSPIPPPHLKLSTKRLRVFTPRKPLPSHHHQVPARCRPPRDPPALVVIPSAACT